MSYHRIRKEHTTDVLGNAGVFTSPKWFRLDQYDRLTGLVKSDQSGTLLINQSTDGVNVDFVTSIAVTGGTGLEIDVQIYGEFAQCVYTNGATPQTYFRLALYATEMG